MMHEEEEEESSNMQKEYQEEERIPSVESEACREGAEKEVAQWAEGRCRTQQRTKMCNQGDTDQQTIDQGQVC